MPNTTATRQSSRGVAIFFWIVAMLAACAGGFVGFITIVGASGAPQEAAGAAIGCLIVIVPYVFARSIDEIIR